jgi:hypothetical protein
MTLKQQREVKSEINEVLKNESVWKALTRKSAHDFNVIDVLFDQIYREFEVNYKNAFFHTDEQKGKATLNPCP